MNPEDLAWFLSEFGEPTDKIAADLEYREKYRGKLPDALLYFWSQYGFCGFNHGLFWVVDPAAYEATLKEWIGDTVITNQDIYHVIARNAFGDLYLWGEKTGGRYKINSRMGWIISRVDDSKAIASGEADDALSAFFANKEPEDMDTKDDNGEPLFDRAVEKLGPLAADEIFAFDPAIIISNRAKLESITKANIFEHLSFLAQLRQGSIVSPGVLANMTR